MTRPFEVPASGIVPGGPELRLQAAGAGLAYRELDLRRVEGRASLMDALARDLSLPAYFGRNLDALYDLLTDPQVFGHSLAVGLCGWSGLLRRHPRLSAALQATLEDAQRDVAEQGRALHLVALESPTPPA